MEEKKKRGRKRIGAERVQVTCPPWLISALDEEVAARRSTCRADAARRILSEAMWKAKAELALQGTEATP